MGAKDSKNILKYFHTHTHTELQLIILNNTLETLTTAVYMEHDDEDANDNDDNKEYEASVINQPPSSIKILRMKYKAQKAMI